jgi:uncharacterized membrane protein
MNRTRRQGFTAGPIDRFMRLPRADFILAAIAFGLCSAMLLSSSDMQLNGSDFRHVPSIRWKFIVIFLGALGGVFFGVAVALHLGFFWGSLLQRL